MNIVEIAKAGALRGQRTKILGGVAVASAVAQYAVGDAGMADVINTVWEAALGMGLITLRSAVGRQGQ